MKKKIALFVLLAGLGLSNASSQNVPDALNSMFRFEGNWQAPSTLVLEGNAFSIMYYANFTKNAESTGMYMEESFNSPDLGELKGYNLIGYNARDEKIHWFSVDNLGTTHDHLGYWVSADHFTMTVTEKHNGKKFEEIIDLTFIDDNHISIHLVGKLANQTVQELTGTFERMPN